MACRFSGGINSPEKLWDYVSEGRSSWSTIPESRFNLDAFNHTSVRDSSVKGGHFLEEDVGLFDTSFFNFTAEAAAAMDPQIRQQLELAFEAIESAGIPVQKLAGSNTAVFAGTFTKDYHDHLLADHLRRPRSLITGNYDAMAANRISHFFDLKGPSTAIDTGCSTSLVGLHLAAQSLRSGETDLAIVGAACVHLNPEVFFSLSNMGTCGPDGICYAFDHRVQGYGRGEGVATIIVKRLSDALAQGDPIRAVVRETGVNQDGKTATITSPDEDAQVTLIKTCYERAGLDPADTAVVEAHGTGTKTGDPIEARAIGKALSEQRSADRPLYLASVKTNLGHTEAASGLAAVIKMAKSLEKGKVAPSINFEKPNPQIDLHALRLKVPTALEDWPSSRGVRRASVNNFGYGGTNAHVILEQAPPQANKLGLMNGAVTHTEESSKLFVLSGKDEAATRKMAANLCDYLKSTEVSFHDLAYTLGQRRSRFAWTLTASARSATELVDALSDPSVKPLQAPATPVRIGFAFNGQGAQWFGMGRELIASYPTFAKTLQECDAIIKDFGADWSILEELQRDAQTSRVNEVQFSMPLSCAIQLALVCLLAEWGIKPSAVCGHSSGEVAAAFAAGALDLREAMACTYFRGLINMQHIKATNDTTPGAMIAVGLGPEDVAPYIDAVQSGNVVVACVNSPSSVTLSGDLAGIDELEKKFEEESIFARKLKVQAAFHSHHMHPLQDEYRAALNTHMRGGNRSFHPGVQFFSPVQGSKVEDANELGTEHWIENMVQPVLFAQCFSDMVLTKQEGGSSTTQSVDMVVEIGPHGALAGPIRQCLSEPAMKKLGITYGSALTRGQDAVLTAQALGGLVLAKGGSVDMGKVNFPWGEVGLGLTAIADLPSYPWNHATRFWNESRISREHRFREHPAHDLLGVRMPGTSDLSPVWRHVLRASDVPWVNDHVVQSSIVYPGSGYIVMAIEAMRQLHSGKKDELREISGYLLQDVEIIKALIILENTDGVEVQLFLEPPNEKSLVQDWRQFHIYSAPTQDEDWVEIAKGRIALEFARGAPTPLSSYPKKMNPKDLFKSLHAVGVTHGPSFQNLTRIRMADGKSLVTFDVTDSAATMPGRYQQPHVIHPITLDAVFQAAYSTLSADGRKLVGASVPRSIKRLYISSQIGSETGHHLKEYSRLLQHSRQGFDVSAAVLPDDEGYANANTTPVIEMDTMHFQSLGRSADEQESAPERLCLITDWKESFALNDKEPLRESLKYDTPEDEKIIAQDLIRATYHFVHDLLQELTEEDIAGLEWHHKVFHTWMLALEQKAAANQLAPKSARWATTPEGVKQMLYDRVEKASINGELAVRLGKNMLAIMRKEIAPLELMLRDQLLYKFYRNILHFPRSTAQAGKVVQAMAAENPRMRILEIGAGTGGCTLPVLQALGGGNTGLPVQFEHYDFTDISMGFFQAAREQFGAWGEMISYQTLNIEEDPEGQNFQTGSYDVIIAAQVLHATKSLSNTMTNVRRLLKDGGKLVLVETTQDTPDMTLIFGTVPGWWLSEEPERKQNPNLPLRSWDRVLRETGFSGLDLNVWDCEDPVHQCMSCIVSTAAPSQQPALEEEVTLVYDEAESPPPQAWCAELVVELKNKLGIKSVQLSGLGSLDATGKTLLFLSGLSGKPQQFTESAFTGIKAMITSAKGVLWVTSGSTMDCPIPENAMHLGLLRTARVEDNSKIFVSLDLDPSRAPWTAASRDAIITVFSAALDRGREPGTVDFEYAERGGRIFIPRLHRDVAENDEFVGAGDNNNNAGQQQQQPSMQPFVQPGRPLRMHVDIPGLLDSIVFRDDPDVSPRVPLPDDWVEIEPKAFGLNFRDVMSAMGQLNEKQEMGSECAGIVTAVGPAAASHSQSQGRAAPLRVGDRVCALTVHGHFANRVRVPWTSVARIPEHMSFETAASFVIVFVTAWYSLFESARAEEGDSVLIHAASGGVGQACIILAKSAGLEVYATVSTPEKRQFLTETYGIPDSHIFSSRDVSFAAGVMAATGGRGVDVVVNSLAGKLLHESWSAVLAPHGRFVEIGKKDIHTNKALDMEPFRRGLSFMHVDVVQLADNRGKIIQRILQQLVKQLGDGTIANVAPVTTYSLADVGRAFRTMQAGKHMGKIVIVPGASDTVRAVPPPRAAVDVAPNATYLVVGGLTGIGQSISRWLVDHGAKNLLLVSRSAASRPENLQFGRELEAAGAKVSIKNCDVGSMASLQSVVKEHDASGMPPIRGVIHSGMVLDDSVLERMTYQQWLNATNSKLDGTRNLHSAFASQSLDFFLVLSSASGVLGSTSQSNYAAGGTYQDALVRHRAAQGLPGVVLDLGIVNSVGFVAETDGVKDRLARSGHRPLEETEVLALVEHALRRPARSDVRTAQIAAGITGAALFTGEPRFLALHDPTGNSEAAGGSGKGGAKDAAAQRQLHEQMASAPSAGEATEVVQRAVVSKLANMFVLPEADIDPAQPLSRYGVDSLVAVELRNWLVPRARIEISIFDLLGSSSIAEVAGKVIARSRKLAPLTVSA
ncbi:hypothetical protein C8A03DRAFT_14873 [Achaetomium macrosporum]|uniref:Polyketide synthase n=1 Tax=Achaetomium macrosporum TaxID=79813 RepID=A0AAN7CAY6_9PEZI|nr:hypothetical protein C8A03DRAFT_14873 [Achaetomium macrosporum]